MNCYGLQNESNKEQKWIASKQGGIEWGTRQLSCKLKNWLLQQYNICCQRHSIYHKIRLEERRRTGHKQEIEINEAGITITITMAGHGIDKEGDRTRRATRSMRRSSGYFYLTPSSDNKRHVLHTSQVWGPQNNSKSHGHQNCQSSKMETTLTMQRWFVSQRQLQIKAIIKNFQG